MKPDHVATGPTRPAQPGAIQSGASPDSGSCHRGPFPAILSGVNRPPGPVAVRPAVRIRFPSARTTLRVAATGAAVLLGGSIAVAQPIPGAGPGVGAGADNTQLSQAEIERLQRLTPLV